MKKNLPTFNGAYESSLATGVITAPRHKSFEDFLTHEAKVPNGGGLYGQYSFAGREALLAVVKVIDTIIRDKLTDAEVALAGGAQFGKTILELNLAAYITSQQFRNFGLYLPDDDLVEGIVDSKFRPDVVDQMEWFARMAQIGKALNKSGRAVNRKGAFLVTDGQRKAVGMIRGLGKVPTTFSMDVAALDEVDDINPKMMKFVRGRLTAGDLRFIFKTGTQRVHGRGMNKAWKDGSQGVFLFKCPECERLHNPEEEFPGIVRLQCSGAPKLTWAGDFQSDNGETIPHTPLNHYYLGCVACGAELDRNQPIESHRVPALRDQRKWSFRISQLAIAAIDLSQIVSRFQSAVADPEEMVVFRCDVLGLPQSTSQALTPAILDRARSVEPYDLAPQTHEGRTAYGGLDMGDRCWLFARSVGDEVTRRKFKNGFNDRPHPSPLLQEREQIQYVADSSNNFRASPALDKCEGKSNNWWQTGAVPSPGREGQDEGGRHPHHSRLLAAERISAGDVVARAQSLFHSLGLVALFIDERPLVNEARSIALALNGLQSLAHWPRITNVNDAYISLPGGLTWDGKNARWLNLKCAVVRFTKTKLGAGIEQDIVFFEEGGQTKFIPCIACNRFETIDRVVREFLTPAEGVVEVTGGAVRETPALLLPRRANGHAPILDTVDAHLITGSEREKATDGSLGDYVDGCENHFLLADGYSKLAEIVCGQSAAAGPGAIITLEHTRRSQVLAARANRVIEG